MFELYEHQILREQIASMIEWLTEKKTYYCAILRFETESRMKILSILINVQQTASSISETNLCLIMNNT
jgi:hypothetical protein